MREMKDSGIEWIGEIPADWETRKIKQLADSNTENSFVDGDWIESPYIVDSGIRYLTTGNIGDGVFKEQGNGYITLKTFGELACKYAFPGDLIISRLNAPYGRSCILPSDYTEYVVAVDNVILRTQEDKRYICYVSQCDGYKHAVEDDAKGTTMKRISRINLGNIVIPLPPIQQQHRIADYLDRKCSQIDSIITRQQEVIEKLKAYKLSVITEAVTKGLNPDVPMKDSGVEWIGEIPEHWTMVRLKFLLSQIIDCPHETPIYSADGDYLVIRTADQDLGKLRADEDMYRLDEDEYQSRIRRMSLEKDDLVYGREGERWGLACLVPESNKYCLGQRMLQFRCKRDMFSPRFAMWALNSKFVYLQGAVDTIGSTSPHVNISTVRNFLIPVPEISEQQEIAEYIDKKILQLDKEVEQRENLICKLNEYKKSLIYEVVTGKKEV